MEPFQNKTFYPNMECLPFRPVMLEVIIKKKKKYLSLKMRSLFLKLYLELFLDDLMKDSQNPPYTSFNYSSLKFQTLVVGILKHVTYIWKKGRQIFKMFFYDGRSVWPIATKNIIK